MSIRRIFFLVLLVHFSTVQTAAQPTDVISGDDRGVELSLIPAYIVPSGERSEYYEPAANVTFRTGLKGFLPYQITADGEIGYQRQTLLAENGPLTLFTIGMGLKSPVYRLGTVGFAGRGGAGLFQGTTSDGTSGRHIYYSIGSELDLPITGDLHIRLNADYRVFYGIQSGFSFGIGPNYRFRLPTKEVRSEAILPLRPIPLHTSDSRSIVEGRNISLSEIDLKPLFPVFYKYYDDHPFGTLIIRNTCAKPLQDIVVSMQINSFMSEEISCAAQPLLAPKLDMHVQLAALLDESIMEISEATKVPVTIAVDYTIGSNRVQEVFTDSLRTYDRNASIWDDDRRAAAFVTAKDPAVLSFAKQTLNRFSTIKSVALGSEAVTALILHESLRQYGISYISDPQGGYRKAVNHPEEVDFLQFPRQTLEYGAGDCDDISILYAALFESIGLEAAFITTPGHIMTAISIDDGTPRNERSLLNRTMLIEAYGKFWIPLETTLRNSSFIEAWHKGYVTWAESERSGQAQLIPIRHAWQVFESVGFPAAPWLPALPDKHRVANAVERGIDQLEITEMERSISEIESTGEESKGSPSYFNRLGVVYARFGRFTEAERYFLRAKSSDANFLSPVLNMAKLYLLQDHPEKARIWLRSAENIAPENPVIILALSRCCAQLGDIGGRDAYLAQYRRLTEQQAEIARSGDTDTGGSRSRIEEKDGLVWSF